MFHIPFYIIVEIISEVYTPSPIKTVTSAAAFVLPNALLQAITTLVLAPHYYYHHRVGMPQNTRYMRFRSYASANELAKANRSRLAVLILLIFNC